MKAASISVPNMSGTFKRFRTLAASGVQEWKNSWDKVKRVKRDPKKVDAELYTKGEDAIAYAFDGGDPIDKLQPYLQGAGLTFADLDRVYKKQHQKSFHQHLAAMWNDAQSDSMSDARSNLKYAEQNAGEYYNIQDGKVVPTCNPWKAC